MKKSVMLLLLPAFISQVSYSQKDKDKDYVAPKIFSYALVAGPAMSSIGGDSDSWEAGLIGGQFGLMLHYDPSRKGKTVFGAEVNYSMQGSKWKEMSYEGEVATSYINLPIVIQHRLPSGFYGEAGIQPGFLVSAKDKYDGNSNDYKEYMNSFDFGIPVGIGYIFLRTIGVNFRYIHGLSNVNKDSEYKDGNRVFALRLFWLPALKKK